MFGWSEYTSWTCISQMIESISRTDSVYIFIKKLNLNLKQLKFFQIYGNWIRILSSLSSKYTVALPVGRFQ